MATFPVMLEVTVIAKLITYTTLKLMIYMTLKVVISSLHHANWLCFLSCLAQVSLLAL
jgi:hypothetical protein